MKKQLKMRKPLKTGAIVGIGLMGLVLCTGVVANSMASPPKEAIDVSQVKAMAGSQDNQKDSDIVDVDEGIQEVPIDVVEDTNPSAFGPLDSEGSSTYYLESNDGKIPISFYNTCELDIAEDKSAYQVSHSIGKISYQLVDIDNPIDYVDDWYTSECEKIAKIGDTLDSELSTSTVVDEDLFEAYLPDKYFAKDGEALYYAHVSGTKDISSTMVLVKVQNVGWVSITMHDNFINHNTFFATTLERINFMVNPFSMVVLENVKLCE